MNERKYPFSLFLMGLITNFLFRFYWLFLPGAILMILGIWKDWCLYGGIGFLALDAVVSFAAQMQIRHTMLSAPRSEAIRDLQNAVSADGDPFENIRSLIESNAREYTLDDLELSYSLPPNESIPNDSDY